MPSFRLKLWKGPKTDPDDVPVYLVVQHGRGSRATLATGVRVAERDWNENKTEVRRSRKNASALNRRLREIESAAADIVDESVGAGDHVTAKGLRDQIAERLEPEPPPNEEPSVDFLTFMEAWVQEYADNGQPSTFKAYRTAHRKLRDYSGGSLEYDDLTASYFKAWGRYLGAPSPHGPGHKQNYVRKVLTSTRTAIREAILRGDAPDGFRDPFERLRGDAVLGTERVKKPSLSMDQVVAISQAKAEPGSLVEFVRDAFAFAFFAGGIRFGDVCLLRWGNVEWDEQGRPTRIVYEAEKTGKETPAPVVAPAAALLDRYEGRAAQGPRAFVFPFLDRRDVSTPKKRRDAIGSLNAYANTALKKLARRAAVPNPDKVSFHVARHSLAAHLLDSGVSPYAIKERLRHTSVSTTERYLEGIDRRLLDDEYVGAFTLDVKVDSLSRGGTG